MYTKVNYLGAACAGAMLLACAGGGQRAAAPFASPASPVSSVSPVSLASPAADALYRRGRAEHSMQRFEAAFDAYERALQIDPAHVNAGNGLAVLYAARGDYARAIALWRGLSGVARAKPESAFLFSNLGYTYLLNGEHEQALAALEKACLLDPFNALAWQHLGSALESAGQGERAALMLRQAQMLRTHDARADYALARHGGTAPVRALDVFPPVAADGAGISVWPAAVRIEVVPDGAGRVRVRRVVGQAATPSAQATLASLADSGSGQAPAILADDKPERGPLRLEIRNGNGVTGMAAALARTVGGDQLQVIRLANAGNFQVAVTRIEYGPEREAAARALAARLGAPIVAPQSGCRVADLRLILGRDQLSATLLRRRYLKQAPADKLG